MKRKRGLRKVGPLCLFAIFCLFGFEIFSDGQVSNNSLHLSPQRIFVNTTADVSDFSGAQQVRDLPGPDGLVSLREAIIAANNTPRAHLIAFRIPRKDPGFDGSVFTIRPLEQFPDITGEGLTIDGSTQTSFSGNTNRVGPEVVLDGTLLDPANGTRGLDIRSAGNRVHSLVIHGFGVGIDIGGPLALRNVVTGCFVGTDAAGVGNSPPADGDAFPNRYGIRSSMDASYARIGGPQPSDRNLISGNGIGVFVVLGTTGDSVLENLIVSNNIGIATNGGCEVCGNVVDPVTNMMIANNVIAFSRDYGIILNDTVVDPAIGPFSSGITISRNSIFSNGGGGIAIVGNTGNDPGDIDIGTNNLMNYPVLTSATRKPGGLQVKGMIDTQDPATVTIELFANPVPVPGGDPSGYGEGAIYLGKTRPNAQGAFSVALPSVPVGTLISATATDAGGNTSEFALNVAVTR